jgi:hypothetical protein
MLLPVAAVTVLLVRLALWTIPARILLKVAQYISARAWRPSEVTATVRSIGWAVRASSRRVPRASCLTQALAAQILLGLLGFPSRLRVGVANQAERGFAAHAWLEIGGGVLVGGSQAGRFRELPDLASRL